MGSLSSLIAILAYGIALCGLLPLFPWLETSPRLILAAGMAAGIWQDLRRPWPLKNWVFNAAIVPVFLFYAIQFSRANPVQPVVSVLAIMLAVRLAGPKNARHYLQISALSLFCLASSSLFDLSPSFLFYLVVMLLMVAVQLVLVTFYSQDQRMLLARADLRKVLLAGLAIPLASLPLLLFFFPILPRTQIPLWNFIATSTRNHPVSLTRSNRGAAARSVSRGTLAFRAEMERLAPTAALLANHSFQPDRGQSLDSRGTPVREGHLQWAAYYSDIYPEPGSPCAPGAGCPGSSRAATVPAGNQMVSMNLRGAPTNASLRCRIGSSEAPASQWRYTASVLPGLPGSPADTYQATGGPAFGSWAPVMPAGLNSWR